MNHREGNFAQESLPAKPERGSAVLARAP